MVRKDQLQCWRNWHRWIIHFNFIRRFFVRKKKRLLISKFNSHIAPDTLKDMDTEKSWDNVQKCALMSFLRSKIWGKVTRGYHATRTMRLQSRDGSDEILYKLSKLVKATFYLLAEARKMPAPPSQCPKKKNCGWFWSFNARAEKRRFELRCKGHHDGQWRSANIRRSTKIRDFGLFVTVQLLDEKSAVQSLGKLCEYHGCFLWVGQRGKSHDWQQTRKNYSQNPK